MTTDTSPTHRGPDRRPRKRARGPVTTRDIADAEAMAAMNASTKAIAGTLKLSQSTVRKILAEPDVRQRIPTLREVLRERALANAVEAVDGLGHRLRDAITADDAKAADAWSRSLSALERTGSSASGENRPASTQIAILNQNGPAMSDEERAELLAAYRQTILAEAIPTLERTHPR